MKKILLIIMLFASALNADKHILILNAEHDSDVVEMLIRGNGEECKVFMDSTGGLIKTTCLQLTNSKKIKILCTKNKKMCKTVDEVHNTLKSVISPKSMSSSVKMQSKDYIIKGNGEECHLRYDSRNKTILQSTCISLFNSKGIKIYCTKNKKMCKTEQEVNEVVMQALIEAPADYSQNLKMYTKTSFDCSKASTQTEHDICHSDKAGALDLELGNIYLTIRNEMPNESFQNLIQIQREWVKERDGKCGTQSDFSERERCLIKAYKERIDAFHLLSVIDSKINYEQHLFQEVYENGTSEERFELAAFLYYYDQKNIKKSSKILRKIIADNQEDFFGAFIALNDLHKDYVKKFPQVSKKLLKKNNGSIGMSLLELNATYDEAINVLIEEGYLLQTAAQIMLMVTYQSSIDGHPAYDKRILSFYEECAEEGVPRCEEFLGNIYLNGWGVKQDIDKGIQLLEQSELEDSYITLGYYYYMQKDIEKCKIFYKKASILGSAEALYNLGVLAQEERQYKKAINYFETSLEENDKYYHPMLELSRMYIEGWGTELNYEKAIDLLQTVIDNVDEVEMKEIAIRNLSIAEYKLGLKYLSTKDSDKTKAFVLFEKSAENNNMYAQFELVKMYHNGDVVMKDEKQEIKWSMKAAEQGHPKAQAHLAAKYLEGKELKEDQIKALNLAKASAENGYSVGQYLYGVLLLKSNRDEAITWLEKSAKQGNKAAKRELHDLLDSRAKDVDSAFGIQLGDYGKNYAIIKDKNMINFVGGKKYNFTTSFLSSYRPRDKKIPKVVDGLRKYQVSSTHLSDRIYGLYGKGKVFKKNGHACKYYTNLFEEVLDEKYGLTFRREINDGDKYNFITYNLVAISNNNVEIKIACSSFLQTKENATLSISYIDKQLYDLNKQEFEEEKKRKQKERDDSLNNL